MPEVMLFQVQRELRDGLQRFVRRGGWSVAGRVFIVLRQDPKTRRRRVAFFSSPDALEDGGIVAAVVELLAQVGDRLRVCPARDCDRIFVGYRKQTFCSAKHAQQARNDRFYQRRKAKELGKPEGKVKINHRHRR